MFARVHTHCPKPTHRHFAFTLIIFLTRGDGGGGVIAYGGGDGGDEIAADICMDVAAAWFGNFILKQGPQVPQELQGSS
jgi:hypothetical protein